MRHVRIGLMGGTFDPIHYGHLFIAEAARCQYELDSVIFFSNRKPAHRDGKSAVADAETRFALMQIGISDNRGFTASRVELDRPGPSFAIDTVQHFQREFGGAAELYYIIGADSLHDVVTWHRSAELLAACRFIAVSRPAFDLEAARALFTPEQLERLHLLEVPGLEISSTNLRRRVATGLPIRYLLPDAVEQEIERRGLYR